MGLITLLTDFGTQDGFVAQMKGVILCRHPGCTIIDVSHDIPPFSVRHAALVLKGLYGYFPPQTVHLAVVDPGVGGARRPLALRSFNSYFVGPDNGIFSWIIASASDWEARVISNKDLCMKDPHPTFHGRDIFAPVAAHLALGRRFSDLGPPLPQPVRLNLPRPQETESGLRGEVIHTDRFGNLTTNIDKHMLSRDIKLVLAGREKITRLSRFFGEVSPGVPLALVNSFGFIELAVNGGDAASYLGLGLGDPVEIFWD